MDACYICNHELTAICARCGKELAISDVRQATLPLGTEIRIEPCECEHGKEGSQEQ